MAIRLGAASVLEAFYARHKVPASDGKVVEEVGDSEVPSQDIDQLRETIQTLQHGLQKLPLDGTVSGVDTAQEACQKVAIITSPGCEQNA